MTARLLRTADGVTIALHRVRAHRDARPAALLVHGAFSGHAIWLRPRRSGGLAHYLSSLGVDVWLADLRHHGAAAREPRAGTWRFEDLITHDAPALVARVREETEGAPLAWIGHSSGGAVGLGWLARSEPPAALTTIVTLATPGPVAMNVVRTTSARLAISLSRRLGRFPARALRLGPEDEAAGILGQWLGWNVAGGWVGTDGFDYWRALWRVRIPMLGIAGTHDWLLAPPAACRQVIDAIGSDVKQLVVAGPRLTHRTIVAGQRAHQQCWPRVATWLLERLGLARATGAAGVT